MVYYGRDIYTPSLYHHGIKGQKWGVRRFQNEDGSYTQQGRARYSKALSDYKTAKQYLKADKQDYKSGRMSKEEYKQHKAMTKKARQKATQALHDIRFDKAADAGRAAYAKKMNKTNDAAKANKAAEKAYYNKVASEWVNDRLFGVLPRAAISRGEKGMSEVFPHDEMKLAKAKRSKYDFSMNPKQVNTKAVSKGKELVHHVVLDLDKQRASVNTTDAETWKALAAYYESQQKRKK